MTVEEHAAVILWFRRDLRLADHPALVAAVATGRPVIPVFVHDETVETLGAAAKWRLGEGVAAFARTLEVIGSRLVLRRGPALDVLRALVAETGAGSVHWTRGYDRDSVARDREVKATLGAAGIGARSFPGAVLFEPWTVETGQGRPYSVYTPFWRAVRGRDPGGPDRAPTRLPPPGAWPGSESLADWAMGTAMKRGAAVVGRFASVGEVAARARLDAFLHDKLSRYGTDRDYPMRDATSGLSEHLAWGEISPRTIWQAAMAARDDGVAGAEKFLSELGWREFAWHLMYHAPDMDRRNWRADWDNFPWRGDNADAERWRRGLTGEPFVDAAMREMFVTGRMHNRARMVAASYLTKHLLTDWRVGLRWFAECLTDWDPAANAMGWQWVAGSGPDAAPFFRIFNPATQAEKFDPDGGYRRAYIAEGQKKPPETARAYFEATPLHWRLSPNSPYPARMIDLAVGRKRALDAYATRDAATAK
ncbi:cryptochrome/photolyase family protein [Defluviimonas sp. SAOS-178_SWC]|uniref:cryptochrome/photolyase family protein n=1 Tax=Defluviimonas sp. SAOS-178_SWC TaxID=3121287 RepID=UPI0032219EC0